MEMEGIGLHQIGKGEGECLRFPVLGTNNYLTNIVSKLK